jgi:hypothetical protein
MRQLLTLWMICIFALSAIAQAAPPIASRAPIDWIFMIDTSGTMLGKGKAKGKNIFADVKQSIYGFLDAQVRVGDSVQLIPFDTESRSAPPTFIGSESDKQYVRRAVESMPAKGRYTYIGDAVQTVRNIIIERRTGASKGGARKYAAIIFTDGIDEPPPTAKDQIDLSQALAGYPADDALFYFVNLGDTSDKNDLYRVMSKDPRLRDHIENSPNGEDVAEAVNRITVKVAEDTAIELFVTAVESGTLVLPLGKDIEIKPVEVRATGAGEAKLEFDMPNGLSISQGQPFFDVGKEPFRPGLRIHGDPSLNDHSVTMTVRVLPAGKTVTKGNAQPAVIAVRFHQPAALERALPWIIALVIFGLALGIGMWLYRRWNTVNLEGLLYVQEPGRVQASEPVDLKTFQAPSVTIGGPGGEILSHETSFRFALRAEGSGGRVRQVVIVRYAGDVAVNGLEHASRVFNEDEIEASGYKIKYENFKLPQRQT